MGVLQFRGPEKAEETCAEEPYEVQQSTKPRHRGGITPAPVSNLLESHLAEKVLVLVLSQLVLVGKFNISR